MDETLRKKINLLVHLAKSDGKFHVSETAFLKDLLRKNGEENFDLGNVPIDIDPLNGLDVRLDKEELLYTCLQLIRADGIIHSDEVNFCKQVAEKLNLNPLVVDAYSNVALPSFEVFSQELRNTKG